MEHVSCRPRPSTQMAPIQKARSSIPTSICTQGRLQTAWWIRDRTGPVRLHGREVCQLFNKSQFEHSNKLKLKYFQGFDKNPGSENGNTNLPPSRPTQSSFPPTDQTGRPISTSFIPPSTSGTYSSDGSEGTSSGDYSTTPLGGPNYNPEPSPNTRPSSQAPDDLYNIKNKYPSTYPTNNRHPQTTGNPPEASPTQPTRPIQNNVHVEPEDPQSHIHHPYPIGPDPFPGYYPQIQPHYHYNLDHDHDYDSHFPGIYAHNTPSLHDNRYYPGAPPSSHIDHYGPGPGGLYAAGRYPESGEQFGGHGGYGGNRKNGYQVTDNTPDIPMPKRELKVLFYLFVGEFSGWVLK